MFFSWHRISWGISAMESPHCGANHRPPRRPCCIRLRLPKRTIPQSPSYGTARSVLRDVPEAARMFFSWHRMSWGITAMESPHCGANHRPPRRPCCIRLRLQKEESPKAPLTQPHGRYLAMYRSRHTCFFHGTGFHGALLRWKARIAEPTIAPLDGLVALGLGFQKEQSVSFFNFNQRARAYGRLSGIGPGAGRRRTPPSPDANGLARAYPRQRIETRPPAAGGPICMLCSLASGDYVANPGYNAHGLTVDYLALAQGLGSAKPATALVRTVQRHATTTGRHACQHCHRIRF